MKRAPGFCKLLPAVLFAALVLAVCNEGFARRLEAHLPPNVTKHRKAAVARLNDGVRELRRRLAGGWASLRDELSAAVRQAQSRRAPLPAAPDLKGELHRELSLEQERLVDELAEREARSEQHRLANPYRQPYLDAARSLQAFAARSRKLTEKFDAAEGAERMRYAEELHRLRPQGLRLKAEHERAKRDYEAWTQAHGVKENAAHVRALRRELEAVAARIAELERSG